MHQSGSGFASQFNFGVRVTPSWQRRLREESVEEPSFDFEPFKEDFQFIIDKLKQDRQRSSGGGGGASGGDASSSHNNNDVGPLVPPVTEDTKYATLEEVAVQEDRPAFGQKYSILERGYINEIIEQRTGDKEVGRKRVALLLAFVAVLLLFGVTAHRFKQHEQRSTVRLEKAFWWGFLLREGGREDVSSSRLCRTTAVSSEGFVVDSEGRQCGADRLDERGCCAESTREGHCNSCRDEDGCCLTYTDCVQCCMLPDHYRLIQYQLFVLSLHGFSVLKGAVFDRFELCSALCRTEHRSVDKHGQYVSGNCYLLKDERAKI